MNAFDRCDQCSAQAMVHIALGPLELMFCGHHWNRHAEKALPDGWKVVDQVRAAKS